MNENCVLGLDIGGTHIRAGLVDPLYRLRDFEMVSSTPLLQSEGSPTNALAAYIGEYCARRLDGTLPRAVSIGFPSTLNKEKTLLLSTPNLPGLNNLPIGEQLSSLLGLPVFINRDVNLQMINDIHAHHIEGADVVIGCYIGTGLGNAIVINGKMLSGKNGVAGELGHVPVMGGTRLCGCGNTGCMETLASGRYLAELHKRYFPNDELSDLFTLHSDSPLLEEYVEMLSVPVATEINLLDPDYVILGGGVLQMSHFPLERLRGYIGKHTRKPLPFNTLQLLLSTQSQKSGIVGAGMYAYEQLEKEE